MRERIKKEIREVKLITRAVPSMALVFFCLSVILMNLFANKEIHTGLTWLALDCGVTLSWLTFLCMDVITKIFGPKASVRITVVAVLVNLSACILFKIISMIPGNWAEFYTFELDSINTALDSTIGGTWYVLMGSTIAMVVSAIVNAFTNHAIGSRLIKDNFISFAIRSYFSTFLAQFVDNLVFCSIVSYNFFGWTPLQCVMCSFTGGIVELLFEIIFSPLGYRISKKWSEENLALAGKEIN